MSTNQTIEVYGVTNGQCENCNKETRVNLVKTNPDKRWTECSECLINRVRECTTQSISQGATGTSCEICGAKNQDLYYLTQTKGTVGNGFVSTIFSCAQCAMSKVKDGITLVHEEWSNQLLPKKPFFDAKTPPTSLRFNKDL